MTGASLKTRLDLVFLSNTPQFLTRNGRQTKAGIRHVTPRTARLSPRLNLSHLSHRPKTAPDYPPFQLSVEEAGAREDTLESKDDIGQQRKQLIAALQNNLAHGVSKSQESRFERSPAWSRMQATASAIRTNIGRLHTGTTRMQLAANSAGASVECVAHSDDLYSESMSRGYEIPRSKEREKRKNISPDQRLPSRDTSACYYLAAGDTSLSPWHPQSRTTPPWIVTQRAKQVDSSRGLISSSSRARAERKVPHLRAEK